MLGIGSVGAALEAVCAGSRSGRFIADGKPPGILLRGGGCVGCSAGVDTWQETLSSAPGVLSETPEQIYLAVYRFLNC
jgi:hypothetical protein